MHELHIIVSFVETHKKAIALLFTTGGLTVSVSLQALLHKASIKNPIVSHLLAHLYTAAATAVAYMVAHGNLSIVPTYATTFIGSQFWHIIAVNPVYNKKILPFLNKLTAFEESVEAAKPATTVTETPATTTPSTPATPFE